MSTLSPIEQWLQQNGGYGIAGSQYRVDPNNLSGSMFQGGGPGGQDDSQAFIGNWVLSPNYDPNNAPNPYAFNYTAQTLPGYEQYMRPADMPYGVPTVADSPTFDIQAYLAAHPEYSAMTGNLGGNEGHASWIQDAQGNLIGQPTLSGRNPDESFMRDAALMVAGGYFGGGGAEGWGAGASGASGGAAAGGSGGLSSADLAALYGDAGYGAGASGGAAGAGAGGGAAGGGLSSADLAALYGNEGYGAGMTGAETGAYDAGLAAGAGSQAGGNGGSGNTGSNSNNLGDVGRWLFNNRGLVGGLLGLLAGGGSHISSNTSGGLLDPALQTRLQTPTLPQFQGQMFQPSLPRPMPYQYSGLGNYVKG